MRRGCTSRCIATKARPEPEPANAASQWHANRFVCLHAKDVDLIILIGYNLSNRTGFKERSCLKKRVNRSMRCRTEFVHRARAASHRPRPACTSPGHPQTKFRS
jgi:hypothetical protein